MSLVSDPETTLENDRTRQAGNRQATGPNGRKLTPKQIEKRKERQRQQRQKKAEASLKQDSNEAEATAIVAPTVTVPTGSRTIKKRRGIGLLTFLLMVVIPTCLVGFYYWSIASDQYQSETRFAVRGTDSTTTSLASLGLGALPGNTAQNADAYIVNEYIQSLQLLTDLKNRENIDMRQFFSREEIDPVYRIEPDMPFEEFVSYWNWMVDAEFNSTTSITTFKVNAFTGEDAGAVSAAVLKAAARLVNTLSTEARKQLIENAEAEVTRNENRLSEAREAVAKFRNDEQTLDPASQALAEQTLTQGLQKEIIELRARRTALLSTVSSKSPTVKVIDRSIRALSEQLEKQLQTIGSGSSGKVDTNTRSQQLNEYSRLVLEQEFGAKSYTTALASLETSRAEAQKQERYFAIVVEPTVPQVALFPYRIINTIIAFAIFLVTWLLFYFIYQSVRDHAM